MASTENLLLSSFNCNQILFSAPTPKTTTKSLSFFNKNRFFITQSILNTNNQKRNSPNLQSKAALAALLFSSISQPNLQSLALDNSTPPSAAPPVIDAQPVKPSSVSPFAQNLLVNAPSPQTQSPASDLPEGTQWRYGEFLNAVKKGKVERVRFMLSPKNNLRNINTMLHREAWRQFEN